MRKVIYLTSGLFLACALGGCVSADFYRNTASSKLCIDYLTLPSLNINHGARAEELARRGENCEQYMGIAQTRKNTDTAFENSLRSLQQPPAQQIKTPIQTTCYRNGQYTNCTTN